MNKILLIDGNPLQWRAVFSKNETYVTEGIITYFFDILSKFPTYEVLLFWDFGKSRVRSELFPEYKANREEKKKELDLKEIAEQKDNARRILEYFGVRDVSVKGVEADDLISFFSEYFSEKLGYEVIIASRDRDLFQLVNKNIKVYDPLAQKLFTEDIIKEEFGIEPKLIPDWKALVGDISDNIPGVKGVGEKNATKYINEFSGISGLLNVENRKFLKKSKISSRIIDQVSELEFCYRLVKLPKLYELPYYFNDDERKNLELCLSRSIKQDYLKADVEISLFNSYINKKFVNSLDSEILEFKKYLNYSKFEAESLAHLDSYLAGCSRCLNFKGSPVLPKGFNNARIMLLMCSPLNDEEVLDKFLADVGLAKENVWITYCCKCALDKPCTYGELNICKQFLANEFKFLDIKFVIVFGNEAMSMITQYKNCVTKHCGEILENINSEFGPIKYVSIMPDFKEMDNSKGAVEFEFGIKRIKEFLINRKK